MMWLVILGVTLAVTVLGLLYMIKVVGQYSFVRKVAGDRNWLRRLLSFFIIVIFFVIMSFIFSVINAIIIFLHIILIRLICVGIHKIIKSVKKRDISTKWLGWVPLAICLVYLAIGYYLCHNVWVTEYSLKTDKNVGSLKVALFADSHLGTTFDANGLKKYLDEMEAVNPDVLVIAGDFVDDGTSREDMVKACEYLGEMKLRYGVYFVYGNHDRGYYRNEESAFSGDDLVNELEKNNVHVLIDEVELVDDRFYIIGREDAYSWEREDISNLVAGLDKDKYMIDLNHQPNDYDNEASAGVDLVLSGHTHGGQLLPITVMGEIIGANDRSYGYEKRNNTDFIVTSGISDWEIQFKTGTKSEYVIIDVSSE